MRSATRCRPSRSHRALTVTSARSRMKAALSEGGRRTAPVAVAIRATSEGSDMGRHARFRPLGAAVFVVTPVTMAVTLAIATTGGAAAPQKEYGASAPVKCVVAPGVLNIQAAATVEMRFKGPESLSEGQSGIEFTGAVVTVSTPAELTEDYVALGVHKVQGQLSGLVIDATNLEPSELRIGPIPWEGVVEKGQAMAVRFPHEGGFSFGPYKVTGKSGQKARLELESRAAFEEEREGGEVDFNATGRGITFTTEGLNEEGKPIIGPLTDACTAPSGVVLAEIPIGPGETSSSQTTITCTLTTNRLSIITAKPDHGPAAGGTSVILTGPGIEQTEFLSFEGKPVSFEHTGAGLRAITPPGSGKEQISTAGPPTFCPEDRYYGQGTFTCESTTEEAEYKNWTLSGTLTDKRLSQAITLPTGSTFNGAGEVNTETGTGTVKGSFAVPAFTAPFKLLGLIPASIGLTFSESAPVSGSVAKSETVSGDELLTLPVSLNVGISSLSALGLKIPTKCATTEPLSLSLIDTLTREELLSKGWSFVGSTTVPKIKCEGGLLGGLLGPVLSSLLSGPENPFSLKVAPPST